MKNPNLKRTGRGVSVPIRYDLPREVDRSILSGCLSSLSRFNIGSLLLVSSVHPVLKWVIPLCRFRYEVLLIGCTAS